MKTKGFTLIEGIIAGVLVLVLAVPMLLGVLDTRRRSRDAARISAVRQVQASLEAYRARAASYPASAEALASGDAELARMLAYQPLPETCGPDRAGACFDYRLTFRLEGTVGALAGSTCSAGPQGLSCSP